MTEAAKPGWSAEAMALGKQWMLSFAKTFMLLMCIGYVLGIVCAAIASDGWPMRATVFVLLQIVFLVATISLSINRAIATTAVMAVKRYELSRRLLERMFSQLPKKADEDPAAPRRHSLQLAEVETHLHTFVRRFDPELPGRYPLTRFGLRLVHKRLVAFIERATLAEFRRQASQGGDLDPAKVRDLLATKVDGMVEDRLAGNSRKAIVTVAVLACIGGPLLAYGVRYSMRTAPATQPATEPATQPATLPSLENELDLHRGVER